MVELPHAEALDPESTCPFKGNMDVGALRRLLEEEGPESVAFVRMEAGTNPLGASPSASPAWRMSAVCREFGVLLILDASLLADNLYFIKAREEACREMSIAQITKAIAKNTDVIYFSARKLGCARGGGICTSDGQLAASLKELLPYLRIPYIWWYERAGNGSPGGGSRRDLGRRYDQPRPPVYRLHGG